MKRYILVAVASFAAGCIFKFAHTWSIGKGYENEAFWYLAAGFVIVFIFCLVAIFLKLVFRKGVQKFNL